MKMKVFVSVLVAMVLCVVFVGAALADGPQDVQYAMTQCGPSIDLVVSGQQAFDTACGFSHQLTTPAQWQGSYISRVNEFAHAIGCPQMLGDDGSPAGALTFAAKIYAPVFKAIYTRGAFPF
jgi:hypothetical protein